MKSKLLTLGLLTYSLMANAQWIEQATGFANPSRGIHQIVIVDKSTVWATAYNGLNTNQTVRDFTVTTNGGTSWKAGKVTGPPNNNNWSCLTAVSANKAWAVFYKNGGNFLGGGLWHTNNGGQTWTQQQAFGSSSFPNIIYMWDENNGFAQGDAVGGEFEIYTTSNGGQTWTLVPGANIPNPLPNEYGLIRALAVKGNTVWFGTTEGRIFKSMDKGYTWSVIDLGMPGHYVVELTFANENTGWVLLINATTSEYIMMRTQDGGNTWDNVTDPMRIHYEITHVPNTVSTLVSSWYDGSTLFGSAYSLDGGDSWVDIDQNVQHLDVAFLNHTVGWSGGFNIDSTQGGIYKYDGSFQPTATDVFESGTEFKVYPNPGNGLFYFSYRTDNNEPIRITVTDVSGKVVWEQTYRNKDFTWLRSIDLRDRANGVYVLRLENDGQHTIHKLVKN
ncbi:MAG: T9SS type A sorting domain-containing protein [Chitinophagales bacterium]|nr:T9SS type A sorting domain-containing protein [Chitinophagales bacterium]MDW8427241.1 T9SS type A sorting domain-containing protein [Chitinophagales bacterium]